MPALGYKSKFVEYVDAGLKNLPGRRIKRQTIRSFRKHPIKVGQTLFHYFGLRTKWCRKIGESVCSEVWNIRISITRVILTNPDTREIVVIKDPHELDAFAIEDGFSEWREMKLGEYVAKKFIKLYNEYLL